MQPKVPIIYTYLYYHLKKRNNCDRISLEILKSVIIRHFICSRHKGGNMKGIPNIYIYDIIKELEEMNLIKKLNQRKFQILKSNCTKKLRKFPY